jgi:hypothetical protein
MKNRILTTSLVLVLILLGCSQEELVEPVSNQDQAIDTYYVLEQKGENYIWSTITRKPEGKTDDIPIPSTPSIATNGAYISEGRPYVDLTWCGFSDETGVYGTAEVQVIAPTFSFHFIMGSPAIVGEGNEAVFEGMITEVISKTGDAPEFAEYWRFCFNVVDVLSVVGNDYDQISKAMMFASPRSALVCSIYPPGHYMWLRAGYNDVKPPGFVEIGSCPEEIE